MKKLFTLLAALSVPLCGFADLDRTNPAPDAAQLAKPVPMYSRVDSIDVAGRSFTFKRKDGVEVKHVLTAGTEIRNGDASAKFEDIKVGDYVAGLRLKKGDTEYEIVKITKFGPKVVIAPAKRLGE